MSHPGGRPLKFKSVEDLQAKIDDYFNTDGKDQPTITGLAIHLDTSRQTLVNYEAKDEYFDTIKRAKSKVELALEKHLFGNNVTGSIFNLKNNFGWKDKTETELTGKDGKDLIPEYDSELAQEFATYLQTKTKQSE